MYGHLHAAPDEQHAAMRKLSHPIVFLGLKRDGQKGFRQSARKRLTPLTRNFGFCWFARYTF
jgi:hypothetical protein